MLRFICYANFVLYVLLPLRKDERRGLRVVFRTLLNIYLNQRGGDILIYVRSDIPSKLLTKHNFPNDIEELFVEINFTKKQMVTFQNISPNLTKRSILFWLS